LDPFILSEAARKSLNAHSVPEVAIDLVELLTDRLQEVAARESRDFDEDVGDDTMLSGLACSIKTKNLAIRDIHDADDDRFEDVKVTRRGFGRTFSAQGTRVHLYSAPNGPDSLKLGSEGIQGGIVARASLQTQVFPTARYEVQPVDLVIAYARDLTGLKDVWVGRMKDADTFVPFVKIFARAAHAQALNENGSVIEKPSREIVIPTVTLKEAGESREAGNA
jgi:hypothetical protein